MNETGMFKPWMCVRCKLQQARYLFSVVVNEQKHLALCDVCKDLPRPPKRPEDKRITELKNGKKVVL